MKVFTKGILESVNRMAETMKYNQSVVPAFLASLPDDKFYIPKFEMVHEHRAGKPCEPHMRCVFEHAGNMFIIDVEMGCYDLIPDYETVLQKVRGEQPATEEANA